MIALRTDDKIERGELTEPSLKHQVGAAEPLAIGAKGLLDYSNLTRLDQKLAYVGARPRLAVYSATALTAVVAWVWIVLLTAGVSTYSTTSLGAGMGILRPILDTVSLWFGESPVLSAIIRFCTPQLVDASDWVVFASTFSMWLAMSVAMMLPSAAPMLRTYADIAHTAHEIGEHTVSISILAAGYLTLWLAFSVVATFLQLLFIRIGVLQEAFSPLGGVLGGIILVGAGVYQFTSFKDACLKKCRNPFTTLFAQWSDKPLGVFRLGMGQGLFCVGCCWALMLVMLVVGTMNLAWMAFFTLFAIVEKSGTGKVTSHATGGILIAWGGILLALSIV